MAKGDFWAGLLVGIAAGAAGSLLATSDKGKEMSNDLLQRAKDLSRKLRKEADEKIDDAREDVADVIDSLRKRLEDIEARIRTDNSEK